MNVGNVVLVHVDMPRINWNLAVIEELIVENDGLVRATNIKTTHGRINRPISKLYPLDVSSDELQPESIIKPDLTDPEVPWQRKNLKLTRPQRRFKEKAKLAHIKFGN